MWPFKFPYTNFHELNLDWIISEVKRLVDQYGNIPAEINRQLQIAIQTGALNDEIEGVTAETIQEMYDDGRLEGIINSILTDGRVDAYTADVYMIGGGATPQECTLFLMSEGKTLLIDCGNAGSGLAVKQVLDANNRNRITDIIITHYHEDHADGFESIAANVNVSGARIYAAASPNEAYDTPQVIEAYNNFMTIAENNNCNVINPGEGYTAQISNREYVRFYNTDPTVYYGEGYNYNNCSMCSLININGAIAWFDGDVENAAQRRIIANVPQHVMLKKMSHHGYDPDGYEDYYKRLSPVYAVCNNGNGTSSDNVPNYLSVWSNESEYLQYTETPTFVTSEATDRTLSFKIGGRWFECSTKRYFFERINRRRTSLAGVSNTYLTDAENLSLKEIIDKMPQSYLEFNAQASWKCCPSDYSNGCFVRIWKNCSGNGQNEAKQRLGREYASVLYTSNSVDNIADMSLVSFYKTSGEDWRTTFNGLPNFISTDGQSHDVSGDDIFVNPYNVFQHKGDAVIFNSDNEMVANATFHGLVILYGSVQGDVGQNFNCSIIRERSGNRTNIVVRNGAKSIAGEEYINGIAWVGFNKGDKIIIKKSGSGSRIWSKVMIIPVAYNWNFDVSEFIG